MEKDFGCNCNRCSRRGGVDGLLALRSVVGGIGYGVGVHRRSGGRDSGKGMARQARCGGTVRC